MKLYYIFIFTYEKKHNINIKQYFSLNFMILLCEQKSNDYADVICEQIS